MPRLRLRGFRSGGAAVGCQRWSGVHHATKLGKATYRQDLARRCGRVQ